MNIRDSLLDSLRSKDEQIFKNLNFTIICNLEILPYVTQGLDDFIYF